MRSPGAERQEKTTKKKGRGEERVRIPSTPAWFRHWRHEARSVCVCMGRQMDTREVLPNSGTWQPTDPIAAKEPTRSGTLLCFFQGGVRPGISPSPCLSRPAPDLLHRDDLFAVSVSAIRKQTNLERHLGKGQVGCQSHDLVHPERCLRPKSGLPKGGGGRFMAHLLLILTRWPESKIPCNAIYCPMD